MSCTPKQKEANHRIPVESRVSRKSWITSSNEKKYNEKKYKGFNLVHPLYGNIFCKRESGNKPLKKKKTKNLNIVTECTIS